MSMLLSRQALGDGLDAFAGSGAVGIEALSRGGSAVTFFEQDAQALTCLQQNIALLPAEAQKRAVVQRGDTLRLLATLRQRSTPFSWVYLDPPYAADLWQPCMQLLVAGKLVAADTLLIAEHPTTTAAPQQSAWSRLQSRKFGAVTLSFYRAALLQDSPL